MVASPKDIDKPDYEGLRGLLLRVLQENAALNRVVADTVMQ